MQKNTVRIHRVMPELREYAKVKNTTVDKIANDILEEAMLHFVLGKMASLKSRFADTNKYIDKKGFKKGKI